MLKNINNMILLCSFTVVILTLVKAQNRFVYPQNSNDGYNAQTNQNINFPVSSDIYYPEQTQDSRNFATNGERHREYGDTLNERNTARNPVSSSTYRQNSETYDGSDKRNNAASSAITRKNTVTIQEETYHDNSDTYNAPSPATIRKITITQEETYEGNNAKNSQRHNENRETASNRGNPSIREDSSREGNVENSHNNRQHSNSNRQNSDTYQERNRKNNDRKFDNSEEDDSDRYERGTSSRDADKEKNNRRNSINNENDTNKNNKNKRKSRNGRLCERKYAEYMNRIFTDEDDHADAQDLDFDGRVLSEPGEYPHMTALGYETTGSEVDYKCGGSLISENFVITAAHCTNITGEKPTTVRIGDLDLMVEERRLEPQIRRIQRIYNHPAYQSDSYYNDIALLKLSKNVEFTEFVRPIRLWVENHIPYDTAYAMGYGATAFGKARTNRLTDLNMTIVANDECNSQMPTLPEAVRGVIDSQICAHDYAMHRDTCQGDSGGPLQLNLFGRRKRDRKHYHLIGITSYGLFCRSDYPSVYTRVSSFLDWIEQIVWAD